MNLYQSLLDVSKQKGQLFTLRPADAQASIERLNIKMFRAMCEENYKTYDAYVNIGSFCQLQSVPISIYPKPLPYVAEDIFGNETTRVISRRLEVCGYIKISDIVGSGGSPQSISRNLIFPRVEPSQKKTGTELEKLESEMKSFFAKTSAEDDESSSSTSNSDVMKESGVVLLHGALKLENMAALVKHLI